MLIMTCKCCCVRFACWLVKFSRSTTLRRSLSLSCIAGWVANCGNSKDDVLVWITFIRNFWVVLSILECISHLIANQNKHWLVVTNYSKWGHGQGQATNVFLNYGIMLSVSSIVVLSICPLVTTVNSGKTADSIQMSFGVVGRVSPRNHVSFPGPHEKGQILGGKGAAQYNVQGECGCLWHRPYNIASMRSLPKLVGISCCNM